VGGRDYEGDVVVGNDKERIAAHRLVYSTRMPPVFREVYATYLEQEATLKPFRARAPAFVYHIQYEFAYADWVMPSFGAQNLAMAAAAVLVCVSIFLPLSIAFLCTISVLCIDVLLLGGMALLGTPLNTITLISLLLALALAIDYSCHIGHAYVMSSGTTRLAKAEGALELMGFEVLNAGMSTLLGTLFLAASRSPVFKIFFVAVWSTILLGLVAGLAFVPVCLSILGPLPPPPSAALLTAAHPAAAGASRRGNDKSPGVRRGGGDRARRMTRIDSSDGKHSDWSSHESQDSSQRPSTVATPRDGGAGAASGNGAPAEAESARERVGASREDRVRSRGRDHGGREGGERERGSRGGDGRESGCGHDGAGGRRDGAAPQDKTRPHALDIDIEGASSSDHNSGYNSVGPPTPLPTPLALRAAQKQSSRRTSSATVEVDRVPAREPVPAREARDLDLDEPEPMARPPRGRFAAVDHDRAVAVVPRSRRGQVGAPRPSADRER